MSLKDDLKKAQKGLIDANMAALLLYMLELVHWQNMKESEIDANDL